MFSASRSIRTLSKSLPSTSRSISTLPSTRPRALPLLTQQQHLPQRRQLVLHAAPPIDPPEDQEDGTWDDLVAKEDRMVDVTESALAQIARAQRAAKDPNLALRIAVESGGCHGYQYAIAVTNKREVDDFLFVAPPPPPPSPATPDSSPAQPKIFIDSASLPLLSGSTIDYSTELIGSQFKIKNNPHANEKGGCGCGVSWELKE